MSSGRFSRLRSVTIPTRTYSAQEVADHFGVAEKTVRRWIETGRLAADRIGHRFAVNLDDAAKVYAESRSGRTAGREAETSSEVSRLREELAVMRGRHEELQSLVERLEAALADERRRNAALELRTEGGGDLADNIVPLCASCHASIHNRNRVTAEQFLARLTDAEYAYVIERGGEDYCDRVYGIRYAR